MAKMFSYTQILMPDDTIIPRRTVFDATPAQAKQFDALKVARNALPEEIAAAAQAKAIADGTVFSEPELDLKAPPSGAPGDPQGVPKGK